MDHERIGTEDKYTLDLAAVGRVTLVLTHTWGTHAKLLARHADWDIRIPMPSVIGLDGFDDLFHDEQALGISDDAAARLVTGMEELERGSAGRSENRRICPRCGKPADRLIRWHYGSGWTDDPEARRYAKAETVPTGEGEFCNTHAADYVRQRNWYAEDH